MPFWFTGTFSPNAGLTLKIKAALYSGRSRYQQIDVLDSYDYGRILVLDDCIMFTERDEFIYHESLAHIPLFSHPEPRDVLVIGGGDGGTVREIAKHDGVSRIDLVEIDGEVIQVCRRFFPTISCGLENEKVNITITDGIKFVKERKAEYDCILIDSTDPVGIAKDLVSVDFYKDCAEALKEKGLIVAQIGSPFYIPEQIKNIFGRVKRIFPVSRFFSIPVPGYSNFDWGFVYGAKSFDPAKDFQTQRYEQTNLATKYYNADIHQRAFLLPNFVQQLFLSDVDDKAKGGR